jgi:hypothetical protein
MLEGAFSCETAPGARSFTGVAAGKTRCHFIAVRINGYAWLRCPHCRRRVRRHRFLAAESSLYNDPGGDADGLGSWESSLSFLRLR